jgi:hypothetical protein
VLCAGEIRGERHGVMRNTITIEIGQAGGVPTLYISRRFR